MVATLWVARASATSVRTCRAKAGSETSVFSDRTTITSSTLRWFGRGGSIRPFAAYDSGWLGSLPSDVSPEASTVPISQTDRRTSTPHAASTRRGRRVANPASRVGPKPEPVIRSPPIPTRTLNDRALRGSQIGDDYLDGDYVARKGRARSGPN